MKPTSTSLGEQKLTPDIRPNIFVCPYPGYNIQELNQNGYVSSYSFSIGRGMEIIAGGADEITKKSKKFLKIFQR